MGMIQIMGGNTLEDMVDENEVGVCTTMTNRGNALET